MTCLANRVPLAANGYLSKVSKEVTLGDNYPMLVYGANGLLADHKPSLRAWSESAVDYFHNGADDGQEGDETERQLDRKTGHHQARQGEVQGNALQQRILRQSQCHSMAGLPHAVRYLEEMGSEPKEDRDHSS